MNRDQRPVSESSSEVTHAQRPPRQGRRCVLSMFSSSEVKVFYPT